MQGLIQPLPRRLSMQIICMHLRYQIVALVHCMLAKLHHTCLKLMISQQTLLEAMRWVPRLTR